MQTLKILSWLNLDQQMWNSTYAQPEFYEWLPQSLIQTEKDFYQVQVHKSDVCCSTPSAYDMVWLDRLTAKTLSKEQLDSLPKAVVFDGQDGFILHEDDFPWTLHPKVEAIVKHSIYTDEADYTGRYHFEDAFTGWCILENMPDWERPINFTHYLTHVRPQKRDTDEHRQTFRKMLAINSQPWHPEYNASLQPYRQDFPPWLGRFIDIGFTGTLTSYYSWSVRYHRVKASLALRNLPLDWYVYAGGPTDPPRRDLTSRGYQVGRREHFSMLRQTKIGLSPWGYTEDSSRDTECAMAGALRLKPYVSKPGVRNPPTWSTWPNYELPEMKMPGMIPPLRIDYENLQEVLEALFIHRERLEEATWRLWQRTNEELANPTTLTTELCRRVFTKLGY